MKRRVVITGMGAITPCGIGVEKFWDSMKNGKSGITNFERISQDGQTSLVAGEIKDKDFNPDDYINPKDAKREDMLQVITAMQKILNKSELDQKYPGEDFIW